VAVPRRTAIVVPVKAFDRAKERLAGVLNASERAALAERLATGVVTAALQSARPVVVVCDDGAIAAWATSLGAEVLRQSGHGLNAAAAEARSHLRGHSSVLAVVHADLAHPDGLAALLEGADHEPGAVLVPDHRRDGTTVLVVPVDAAFTFAYGPASFDRHCREAERLGLGPFIVEDSPLSRDVDVPEDLAALDGGA
jgi:2-phospho-L-lactate guanylyltransferase